MKDCYGWELFLENEDNVVPLIIIQTREDTFHLYKSCYFLKKKTVTSWLNPISILIFKPFLNCLLNT